MQFLRLQDAHAPEGAPTFRYPIATAALQVAVFGCLTGWLFWVGLRGGIALPGGGRVPAGIAYWSAVWLGIFLLISLNDLTKRLKPENWLVKVLPHGLFIKYRSYLNRHLPSGDPQVLYLAFSEIGWARAHDERLTLPGAGRDPDESRRVRSVELQLRGCDLEELELRLAAERAKRQARGARHLHFPVQLLPEGVLRILWEATPGAPAFVEGLRGRLPLAPERQSAIDLTGSLAVPVSDDVIAELARSGNVLEAMRILRARDGLDATAAHRRVRELMEGRPPPGRDTQGA